MKALPRYKDTIRFFCDKEVHEWKVTDFSLDVASPTKDIVKVLWGHEGQYIDIPMKPYELYLHNQLDDGIIPDYGGKNHGVYSIDNKVKWSIMTTGE